MICNHVLKINFEMLFLQPSLKELLAMFENETAIALENENDKTLIKDVHQLVESYPRVPITVDCAIFGFDNNELKVLLIRSDIEMYNGKWSLLGDFARDDEDLDDAAYRVLRERTG